jgi:small-conductance mechanosensitive channel
VRAHVLAPAGVDAGLQETLSLLLRYALLIPAALVLLQVWGIDMRALAILASVLGLGIGFGLQNIANNFVSGLLLNLERPIRPGDYVEVGGSAGTVERIGARSTLVRTVDQVAILVPNSRLLESEVINWSHGDPLSRLHVPVGVSYGSDPDHVKRVLLRAAQGHPSLMREPRPRVELRAFGPSSLEFELLVWTRDPRGQRAVVSDLNYCVHAALGAAGIEIPFAQQDVSLRAPALERWLEAWSGRPVAAEPAKPAVGVAPELPPERPPAEWSAEEVAALVARMRGPGGLSVQDRRYRLRSYPRAFVGREAVAWLIAQAGLTREDAIDLGRRLVADGIVHHVLDEHDFCDANLFYRFRLDDPLDAGQTRVG